MAAEDGTASMARRFKLSLHGVLCGFTCLLTLVQDCAAVNGVQEYCQNEVLRAKCSADEVVVMRLAKYGRMKLSRCVSKDYGYLGCGQDVLNIAHAFCSGRRECEIPVPNENLDRTQPCPDDFKNYLEASYDCIKVITAERRMCQSSTHIDVTSPRGIIASRVTSETGCGSHRAPWIIQARPGQTINITLWDYSPTHLDSTIQGGGLKCIAYAILREKNVKGATKTICAGSKRDTLVYQTTSHSLEIIILGSIGSEINRHFLLQYQVGGCPDPNPPHNGWSKRYGQQATVGCNHTPDQWRLTCAGTRWTGELGNCTAGVLGETTYKLPFSYGLSIGIIVLIAIAIAVCILLAGLVCLKSRRRSGGPPAKQALPVAFNTGTHDPTKYKKSLAPMEGTGAGRPGETYWSRREFAQGENEYASIQENMSPTLGDVDDITYMQRPHAHGNTRAHSPYQPPSYSDYGSASSTYLMGRARRVNNNPCPQEKPTISPESAPGDIREYYELDADELRSQKNAMPSHSTGAIGRPGEVCRVIER